MFNDPDERMHGTRASTLQRIEKLSLYVTDSAHSGWKLLCEDGRELTQEQIIIWRKELRRKAWNNTDRKNELHQTTMELEEIAQTEFEDSPGLRAYLWRTRLAHLTELKALLGIPRGYVQTRVGSPQAQQALVAEGEDLKAGFDIYEARERKRNENEHALPTTLEELNALYIFSAKGAVFLGNVEEAESREKKRARLSKSLTWSSLGLLSPQLSARRAGIYQLLD